MTAHRTSRGDDAEIPVGVKVAFLSDPRHYPFPVRDVEVRETHMSWVFLTEDRVFKMKKPVRYPFLDFGTFAARSRVVRDEIRLNRRLAPDVYIGEAALTLQPGGGLAFGGDGPVVEWLVAMRRLPEARMLDHVIIHGGLTGRDLVRVGERLVGFYRALPAEPVTGPAYVRRFEDEYAFTADVLADPHFAFDGAHVAGILLSFEQALAAVRPLLAERAAAGRIVEGHGDLRPEHVCLEDPPAIIDCLEFDRRLRLVDPFDEIVYLGLECARLGAERVLSDLRAALENGLRDRPPAAVLAFYWRYRALLRARLALLHLVEPHPRTPQRWRPEARRYLEFAEEADLRFRSRADR